MCKGSWIVKDHLGEVLFHARDVFLPVHNRIAAELRGILWALQSMYDIHCENVKVWSECGAVVEAIRNPIDWLKYRSYLDRFKKSQQRFQHCEVNSSTAQANKAARRLL
ncbi:hypothetical protein V5N11_030118 [Cardamine amara subsp. amara]|uniref:RNase H type-1 domain-containing protein n=1 Tax=Cardamine amara subsp. amara TaxID=228776 RepID=A0ABD0ZQ02_CARAN